MDIPAIVTLSLIALVLEYYFVPNKGRDFRLITLYAALIFGLFPYTASFVAPLEAVILALLGAGIFTVATFLFDNMVDRLSTGPAAKIAPIISAFGLYLACQCFMGLF